MLILRRNYFSEEDKSNSRKIRYSLLGTGIGSSIGLAVAGKKRDKEIYRVADASKKTFEKNKKLEEKLQNASSYEKRKLKKQIKNNNNSLLKFGKKASKLSRNRTIKSIALGGLLGGSLGYGLSKLKE